MTRKNVVKLGTLLITLGVATLFGFQANSQTVKTFIEAIEFRSPTPHTTSEEYDGPQTVKGLMNAFDAAYNQRFSKARVIALCKDGVVYSSELAISGEIDARYSRVEWLQMLLQRGITIENFDDYRIYLPKRHTLAFLTDIVKITQPPPLETTTLGETFRQSAVDVLLLCFLAVVLTTVAFLKFFRSDI